MNILHSISLRRGSIEKWVKNDIFFIFFLTAIAAVLRFYKLTDLPCGLFPDQAIHGLDAIRFAQGVLSPVYHGNEGLFVYLVAISHFLFDTGTWQIFIVSSFIGTLTIPAVFLFVKEIFGRNIAFLTSSLLAISGWHIALSRNGFRAILVPLLISLTLFFFFKAFHTREFARRRTYFALCTISLGLGFYTYYSFLAFPLTLLIIFLFLFLFRRKNILRFYQKNRSHIFEFFVFSFLILFPLLLFIVLFPTKYFGRIQDVSALSGSFQFFETLQYTFVHFIETLKGIFTRGDPNWRHNAGMNPFLPTYLLPFFLFGFFHSFFCKGLHRFCTGFCRILPFLFLGMILPAALSREGYTPHGLRLIGIVPFLFIFPALGFFEFFGFLQKIIFRRRKTTNFVPNFFQKSASVFVKGIFFFFLIFIGFQEYSHYFRQAPLEKEYYNAFRCDLTLVAEYIENHRDEKIVLIIDDFSYLTLKYLFYPENLPYQRPESFFQALQSGNIVPRKTYLVAISYGDDYWKVKKFLEKKYARRDFLNPFGEPAFYLFKVR